MSKVNIDPIDNKHIAYPLWFFFTVLFILFDYSRIYNELHLGFLRPLMILTLILTYFIFSSGEYRRTQSKQTTYMWFFIILLACYIPFARNNFFAYEITKAQLLYMPFILSVILTVNTIERLKKFILIFICIMTYIAIYALVYSGLGPGKLFFR